jgi:PAS domain S-box-containing protein
MSIAALAMAPPRPARAPSQLGANSSRRRICEFATLTPRIRLCYASGVSPPRRCASMASSPKAGVPLEFSQTLNWQELRGEHLRLLHEHVPVITWTTDTALRITSVAGAGLATLGLDPEQLRGLTLREYFQTDDDDFLPIAVHRRALGGVCESYQVHILGRTYQAYVEPLREDGTIVGAVGVALDVTERAAAESELADVRNRLQLLVEHRTAQLRRANAQLAREAMERERASADLQAARERLAFLVSGSPAVIYTARADGPYGATFTGANVRALTGHDPTCFSHSTFWLEHLHPDDRQRVLSDLPRLYERGWHVHEYRFRCADGTYRWIHDGLSLVRDAEGRPVEIVGYWIDASERKRLELELREAKDAAEQAVREKNEFLATISHEIRNPMNAIIGSAGLLLETQLTPDQQQYARIVRRSAEALLAIVDDVLDLTKMEAGRLRLQTTDLAVDTVLEEVVELFAEQAHAKRIELIADADPAAALPVRGDPGRLRQVLVNLVGNALKFTDRGEVVVRACVAEVIGDALLLRFEVRDTGIGISEQARPRLFQAFSQIEGPGARRPGGTGLGLAISKRLVELMGGTIDVDSAPDVGSTFWFTARVERAVTAPPAPVPEPELAGQRILVVDPSPNSREARARVLGAAGMVVDVVASGTDALARMRSPAAASMPYALVLIDLEMPGMSGLEVAQAVCADPALVDNRIVLLTPFGRAGLDTTHSLACVVGTVAKPVRASVLRARMKSLILAEPVTPATPRPALRAKRATRARPAARILVVEDDLDIQTVTAHSLRKVGYRVDVVGNGLEAVEAVTRAPYDLVLMDSRLPGMDGLQAVRTIRERERGSDRRLRIVALTASMGTDEERFLAAGMDAVLRKPVRLRSLLETVAAWAGAGSRSA